MVYNYFIFLTNTETNAEATAPTIAGIVLFKASPTSDLVLFKLPIM